MDKPKEDNTPLGIAEKGARMGKEWFDKNIEKNQTDKNQSWIEEFDRDFNFFKDITITPRQVGDFKQAEILQTMYRSTGDRIKDFIKQVQKDTLSSVVDKIESLYKGQLPKGTIDFISISLTSQEASYNQAIEHAVKLIKDMI